MTTSARRGTSVTFTAYIQNDGTEADRIVVKAAGSTAAYTVRYRSGTTDITDAVVAGTWKTKSLAPGKSQAVLVTVTVKASAAVGSQVARKLVLRSAAETSATDAVKLVVKRR